MELGKSLGSRLVGSIQPGVGPETGAGSGHTYHDVERLAVVGKPPLKDERLHKTRGTCPGQDRDDCPTRLDRDSRRWR